MTLSGTGREVAGVRVVLYVRAGCHLCDEAAALVDQVCSEVGVAWGAVDVDELALEGETARELAEEYSELVPVVVVDGVRRGYWRLDAGRLRQSLAARRSST